MAGSINKCAFIGNLGKDPEVRTTQSGAKVVSFSIAVSDVWKDKSTGERQEKTTWVPIVIFNEGLAKVAEQYLKKGSKVYVEGAFQVRKWTDKDGADRYNTEIVLAAYRGELALLDSRPESTKSASPSPVSGRSHKPAQHFDDLEDQIPFNMETRWIA